MPYGPGEKLPSQFDKYSDRCRRAARNAFNSAYDKHGEEKAFAIAHAAAKRCMESKMTDGLAKFNIYSGVLKADDSSGAKRLKTVASSTIVDRAGDSMTENAIRKMAASAKDNLTIFLNHSYNVPEDVFGSVEDARVVRRSGENGQEVWDLDLDIRLNDANPRAVTTYDAILSGTKLGTSIGAKINEGGVERDKSSGGLVFDDVELLEASIVALPANPRSWVQYAMKALADTSDDPDIEKARRRWVDVDDKGKVSVAVEDDDGDDKGKSAKKDETPEVAKAEDKPENEPSDLQPTSTAQDPSHPENNEPVGDPGAPAAQGGQETEPESADEDEARKDLVPDAVKAEDFVNLIEMLRTTTSELVEARKALGTERDARQRAEEDARKANEELSKAKDIVEVVANLPMGRRSVVNYHVNDFRTKFGHLYGEDFVKMLEIQDDSRPQRS